MLAIVVIATISTDSIIFINNNTNNSNSVDYVSVPPTIS